MLRRSLQISMAVAALAVGLAALPQEFGYNTTKLGFATPGEAGTPWEADATTESFRSGMKNDTPFGNMIFAAPGADVTLIVANNDTNISVDFTATALSPEEAPTSGGGKVPEPGTLVLLGSGLIAMARLSRSRRATHAPLASTKSLLTPVPCTTQL